MRIGVARLYRARRDPGAMHCPAERLYRPEVSLTNMARVALIQTGGTIDSVGTDRLDIAWYTEAGLRLKPGELVAAVPELATIADLEETVFRRLPSHALTHADWLELAQRVESLLRADFD